MTIPYTYFLHWTSHNMSYFGRRTATGCDPTELWRTYFTSSKYVKEFRKTFGEPDIVQVCNTFTDAKSCVKQETLVLYSCKAARDPLWLNRTNGDMEFDTTGISNAIDAKTGKPMGMVCVDDPRWASGEIIHHLKGRIQSAESNIRRSITQTGVPKPHSKEHGLAISIAKKGCVATNKGIPHSESTKEKIRQRAIGRKSSLKGKPKSEEQKRKQSETMRRKHLEKLRLSSN